MYRPHLKRRGSVRPGHHAGRLHASGRLLDFASGL